MNEEIKITLTSLLNKVYLFITIKSSVVEFHIKSIHNVFFVLIMGEEEGEEKW